MSFSTLGWARFRGLDILSMAVWKGKLYFGTRDRRVMVNTGFVDGVTVTGDVSGAQAIDGILLGAFSALGSPRKKMVRQVRAYFLTHGVKPAVSAFARYDYDTSEPAALAANPTNPAGIWNVGAWDVALWGADTGIESFVFNTAGRGSVVAFGVRVRSADFCVFTGIDVSWEEGGLL